MHYFKVLVLQTGQSFWEVNRMFYLYRQSVFITTHDDMFILRMHNCTITYSLLVLFIKIFASLLFTMVNLFNNVV